MENNEGARMESVYSNKVRAGRRRTYFFDVRQTKGDDYYITLTESTKRFNGDGYNRHKIFLYKEDFNRFVKGLEDAVNHVKTNLMPDFDYELYEKRQEEWEAQMKAEQEAGGSSSPEPKKEVEETASTSSDEPTSESTDESESKPESESDSAETEDDITW